MAGSMSIVTAEVSFLDTSLSLIHIPTSLYSFFIQPILRLLFGEDHNEDATNIPWTNRHLFLNLTITPIEVSIICSRSLGERLFGPLVSQLRRMISAANRNVSVEISYEEYTAIQVDGQGLDAGQRVLELTSPLAMAGIPLFFISTYFSDFVIVPSRARHDVTKLLEQRGFAFSKTADAFVSQLASPSPTFQKIHSFPTSPVVSTNMPSTPPAKDITELEIRTFTKLKKNQIEPTVERKVQLVNCAGQREPDPTMEAALQNDLMQLLLATTSESLMQDAGRDGEAKVGQGTKCNGLFSGRGHDLESLSFQDLSLPVESDLDLSTRFLSVTITSNEPISIFMEHGLLDRLGSSLLGAKDIEDVLIPITLDLRDLPIDATGIVCGVAGRLARGQDNERSKELGRNGHTTNRGSLHRGEGDSIDILFLSTAKAGNVLVRASELDSAMEALERGMEEVAHGLN